MIDAVTTHAVEHQEHAQVHLATRSMDLGVTSRQAITIGKSTISTIITTTVGRPCTIVRGDNNNEVLLVTWYWYIFL
jgi:hypothetical protein